MADSLFEARDLDVVALAIQNTVDDANRLEGLAALGRIRRALLPDIDGRVPSAWYLDAKARSDACDDLVVAARAVVDRWRDVKHADDEIALLSAALSRAGKA